MIVESDIDEIPGFSVVELRFGYMIVQDNTDWHTFIKKTGHAIKTQKLPNMRMKWGYAECWESKEL